MTTMHVAIDNIRTRSQDAADLQKFCDAMKSAGYEVSNCGVGPNKIQSYQLKKSHQCDIMIQIAGGLCTGTLGDFIAGIKRGYYYAKKGAIVYDMVANNLNAKTWKCVKAHDWYYSMSTVTPYLGKTLPQVYSENTDVLVGFADGKNIDEVINNFLKCLGKKGGGESGDTGGGASSALDLLKQVCSDWDPYGVELGLVGDTVTVARTKPSTAQPLTTNNIAMNSVNYVDYDHNTPNSYGGVKDQALINRFGEIPFELEIDDPDKATILRVAQRGHGHSIDMNVYINPNYVAGKWVNLTIPELGIDKKPYYISKSNYQDERLMNLTLECAPPSIYVEPEPEVEEDETATEEEDTGEE